MNIGLVTDSKLPNLALMKISAYMKKQGHNVFLYNPLFSPLPDVIYSSKIFKISSEYQYYPDGCKIIKGGSGYSLSRKLPDAIEYIYPDYSLFNCKDAIGFTSRGCIRKCKFCIVPEKEGGIKAVSDIYSFWRDQKKIILLDNNILALPEHFKLVAGQIKKENIEVDFNQGLDIRLINEENSRILAGLRTKILRFSWDNMKDEKYILRGIKILKGAKIPISKIFFYCLIGYGTTREEDVYRVEKIKEIKATAFAMPFNKKDPYQKQFALWVNQHQLCRIMTFEEYKVFHRERGNKMVIKTKEKGNNLSLGL